MEGKKGTYWPKKPGWLIGTIEDKWTTSTKLNKGLDRQNNYISSYDQLHDSRTSGYD
jgi:hypothetical protein